ncbi:CDP-glycerol glycerophosphotransferase family protein [Pseudolabrys sp.]|uniref:CDP-glycerol glycerophosphotransferase family protein n=1 Tax=Pseudolabrys sp. TaxID=1960880 RepID=UPI003D118768
MKKRSVTFYHTDNVELHALQPIHDIFQNSKRYIVRQTTNIYEKSDIGIYCQHYCVPSNSLFSVILLHDMAQGHNRWPNIWDLEPWDDFDVAVLPGPEWSERWKQCSWTPKAHPRIGVFELGWPKADKVVLEFADQTKARKTISERFKLLDRKTVLYAPSWENDGKQNDVVEALRDLPINLILKQAPWSNQFPQILKNIDEANAMHRRQFPNVYVADPNENIFDCIMAADVIVSDESSVMVEGLALGVPSIAVMDWLIPDRSPPRRPDVPFSFVLKSTRSSLREDVRRILFTDYTQGYQLIEWRERTFSKLGTSARSIFELIDATVGGEQIPFEALRAEHQKKSYTASERIKRLIRKTKAKIRKKQSEVFK